MFCETCVLNKLNAHRLKYFKSLVLLIMMILAHIHYLNKFEYGDIPIS